MELYLVIFHKFFKNNYYLGNALGDAVGLVIELFFF